MTGTGTLDAAGAAVVPLSQHVSAPKLWSAEKPNLYYLVTTLSSGGKPLERIQERFGFRQIEIKDGVLLWNGVPIKCTGTCRHGGMVRARPCLDRTRVGKPTPR